MAESLCYHVVISDHFGTSAGKVEIARRKCDEGKRTLRPRRIGG